MKVYVDELPKDCWNCPCFKNDVEFSCGLSDGIQDYFLDEIDGGQCPLIPITNYDKQVKAIQCKDKQLKQYLENLDKDTLIELYLQKCYENEIERS